jgi:hypothetical protein
MAEKVNIVIKNSGEMLTAGEFNELLNKTNAAITEQNQTKSDHASALTNKVDVSSYNGANIKQKLGALTDDERLDASAIKNIPSTGSSTELIIWPTGSPKPTVEANKMVGDFVEGHTCSAATCFGR